MKVNDERVPHYKLHKVPIDDVLTMVSINKGHLKEKDTWFLIDGKLNFFKPRNDYRIIGELLCSDIQKSLGMNPVDYSLAYINGQLGIISENFQEKDHCYYHVSDLYRPEISSIKAFGDYSFKTLCDYFDAKLEDKSLLKKIKLELAQLFIVDYLTHQEDRNFKNIMFDMKVQGIEHKFGMIPSIHGRRINDISLSKIFDNEKSFSIGRNGVYDYKLNKTWDTSFKVEPNTGVGFFDDEREIDINLLNIYMDYPELCTDFMKKIVDEFNPTEILSKYQQGNSQIIIRPNNVSYIDSLLEKRQKGIRKVLEL